MTSQSSHLLLFSESRQPSFSLISKSTDFTAFQVSLEVQTFHSLRGSSAGNSVLLEHPERLVLLYFFQLRWAAIDFAVFTCKIFCELLRRCCDSVISSLCICFRCTAVSKISLAVIFTSAAGRRNLYYFHDDLEIV